MDCHQTQKVPTIAAHIPCVFNKQSHKPPPTYCAFKHEGSRIETGYNSFIYDPLVMVRRESLVIDSTIHEIYPMIL